MRQVSHKRNTSIIARILCYLQTMTRLRHFKYVE